ncbi:hypothetical protein EDB92DRAFT_1277032 [Lactarius akahatsu]|uniref:Peptidase A1 domain-containing protein n=1 Tax=Lactarius akahatsu TaxID=416441 RepID=A0AAD4QB62_9AGAM|nr:hypothetical protein EDB92DRAFT_1277032 [Lactarius akahatsu]
MKRYERQHCTSTGQWLSSTGDLGLLIVQPSTTILSTTARGCYCRLWNYPHTHYRYKTATGAVLDASTGLLRIAPTQFNNLQSLFFTAGGISFELTANAQIWLRAPNTFIGGTSGNIYLVVNDIGTPSGEGLDFINGYTFLERLCSVFDNTNNRIGFATTPFTHGHNQLKEIESGGGHYVGSAISGRPEWMSKCNFHYSITISSLFPSLWCLPWTRRSRGRSRG